MKITSNIIVKKIILTRKTLERILETLKACKPHVENFSSDKLTITIFVIIWIH